MANPTVVEVPHELGRAKAKRRLERGLGPILNQLPGGPAAVTWSWASEYQMLVNVKAMGQAVSAVIDVEDGLVRAALTLPPVLSFFAKRIADSVRRSGERLLLPKA